MSKILDCTNIVTIYKSLQHLIGDKVIDFVGDNKNRIQRSANGFTIFDRPSIEEIKDYLNINFFDYDEITVHHATSIINRESFDNYVFII